MVGKSAAWVNRLLKWRQCGYQDTAFGPQAKASRARAHVQTTKHQRKLNREQRETLVKSLGMLGSNHPGERDAAALAVEKQRTKLDMSWDQLIVEAKAAREQAH
jgi:hypothetical protein